ncbi:MAG: multifunctional CCA addition/repair protein [Pseudomonadota bacterium]
MSGKIYTVGGAVRDELLGLPVQDRDFVVVGATPEEMVRLGFQPVGKDFPVFLHPKTHEEYALARTERKTARGYKGFQVYAAPEVTLEQDLARRDLTINAIAKDETGALIDPYSGQRDLAAKVLRHVSPAFSEDPVRILRVARFAARFADFTVAEETLVLMREMVQSGEVDALVPERVWQEISRGLMEAKPSRLFEVLRACGALARIMPEVDCLFGVPQHPKSHPEIDTGAHVMLVLDMAAAKRFALPVRYAALCHDLGKGATPPAQWPNHNGHEAHGVTLAQALSRRIKAPSDCAELAVLVARWHGEVHNADQLPAEALVKLLQQVDAFRQPPRFVQFLQACAADYWGRPGYPGKRFIAAERLANAYQIAAQVDAGAIAQQHQGGEAIKQAIFAARCEAVLKSL